MLEKLEAIFQRWKDVEAELSSPDAMADMKRFAQLNKEYKDLAKVVDQYNIYRNIMSGLANASFPDGSTPDVKDAALIAANLFAAGQETTVRRRENRCAILAKPPSSCACSPVSLPRTVCGVSPALLTWSWLWANVRNRTAIEPADAQNLSISYQGF